jgi:hypothetical protein
VPDDHDYADLAALLARREPWIPAEADLARLIRRDQADTVTGYDQRDSRRVAAMQAIVAQLDKRWRGGKRRSRTHIRYYRTSPTRGGCTHTSKSHRWHVLALRELTLDQKPSGGFAEP